MRSSAIRPASLIVTLLLLAMASHAGAAAVPVEVKRTDAGWQLLRDGEPYTIKGAGGDQYLHLLAASGANSIRTWGAGPKTKALLDEAYRYGLTVTVGIWLGHERHGFDYNDLDQVAKQLDHVREVVTMYKDHPAVLAWGVGNEMEGYEAGDNAAIWSHVEACAALIKRLDPHHPTMTVIAEVGGKKVEAIHRLCPSIDIVGINSYAGAKSLPTRYPKAGGTKPYVVAEFGPPGAWEVEKTSYGAPGELTSTQKGPVYRAVYEALDADRGMCLGSYAFLWG
ncbi:MAG: glycoside hydrolase family 2 TIM barrel-domain containing protein, partial [Phycisphaeraceae bacterium]